jgi:hypothetical protein
VHPTCGPTQPDDIPGIVRYSDQHTHNKVISQHILRLLRYPATPLYQTYLFLFHTPFTLPPYHVSRHASLFYSSNLNLSPSLPTPISFPQIQDLRGAQGADQQPTHQLGLPSILHAHGRSKRYVLCSAV